MTTDTPKLLLTEAEAARLLSISPRSLFSRAAAGEIAVVKIGKSKRYSIDDLRQYIDRQRTKNPAVVASDGPGQERN